MVASLVGEETHRSPMDIDGTGSVNILDLTLVASNVGESGTHAADVNGDCEVNTADLLLVASAFGNTVSSSEDVEE